MANHDRLYIICSRARTCTNGVCAARRVKKIVAIPVLLLVLTAFLVLMKLYMNGEQVFMSAIYLLIALTFLNNAFFSISAGFFSLFLYRIMLIAAFALFIWRMRDKGTYISQWQQIRVKGILGFLLHGFFTGSSHCCGPTR